MAKELIGEARDELAATGERAGETIARCNLAVVDAKRGRHAEALQVFREALTEADELSYDALRLHILNFAAPSHLAVEGAESALEFALEALTLAEKLHDTYQRALAHGHVADARAASGDEAGAAEARRVAEELLARIGRARSPV